MNTRTDYHALPLPQPSISQPHRVRIVQQGSSCSIFKLFWVVSGIFANLNLCMAQPQEIEVWFLENEITPTQNPPFAHVPSSIPLLQERSSQDIAAVDLSPFKEMITDRLSFAIKKFGQLEGMDIPESMNAKAYDKFAPKFKQALKTVYERETMATFRSTQLSIEELQALSADPLKLESHDGRLYRHLAPLYDKLFLQFQNKVMDIILSTEFFDELDKMVHEDSSTLQSHDAEEL